MATFKVDGRMTVSSLKSKFMDAFGTSLRVYQGNNAGRGARFADDKQRLGEVADERKTLAGLGEFEIIGEMTVDSFEKAFQEKFDIAVQVATPDNSKLAKNDSKLVEVKDA